MITTLLTSLYIAGYDPGIPYDHINKHISYTTPSISKMVDSFNPNSAIPSDFSKAGNVQPRSKN